MRVGSIPTGRYVRYARGLSRELLELRESDALKISHFLHLRAEICSETLADEMAEFDREDRVGIVSLMDHTPGQRQFRDISKLEDYYKGKYGMSDAGFAAHVAHLRQLSQENGAKHEALAVAEAQRYGAVLASHDDTTIEQVEISVGHGVAMAEFPTTQEAAEASHAQGIAVIMGAPNLVRGGSHSGNVAASDLAETGTLDILSSDYVPSALLLSAFHLARVWDDLPRAVATVTRTPARAARLDARGVLKIGTRGDVLRVRQAGQTPLLRGVWSQGNKVG